MGPGGALGPWAPRGPEYLPPGTWFHVWTGEEHAGGAVITVEAPIGSPPVFAFGEDRPDLRAIPE